MNRDYEYFTEFFKDPTQFNNFDFHEIMREWIEHMQEHAGEFNYLEDEEWRERRERIIEDIGRRVDIREEFDELIEISELNAPVSDADKITIQERWVNFLKNNQFDYEFTDEQIAAADAELKELKRLCEECRIFEERAKIARLEEQKALANLDEALVKYYERTGKRIVLPAHTFKKKPQGN